MTTCECQLCANFFEVNNNEGGRACPRCGAADEFTGEVEPALKNQKVDELDENQVKALICGQVPGCRDCGC